MVNDQEALTLAYLGLSRVAFADGDYDHSLALAVKARDSARDLDRAMGQAPLFLHASATRLTGDYEQAAALFEQSLDLNRKIGDQGMVGTELQNLAFVEIHRGNVDAAERYVTECEKLGPANDPYHAAMTNLTRAMIAFARGDKNMSRTLAACSVYAQRGKGRRGSRRPVRVQLASGHSGKERQRLAANLIRRLKCPTGLNGSILLRMRVSG